MINSNAKQFNFTLMKIQVIVLAFILKSADCAHPKTYFALKRLGIQQFEEI